MESKEKKTKLRSPNFPAIALPEAIEKARLLYNKDGMSGTLRPTAYQHLGFTSENGSSLVVVSALRKYGLTTEDNNRIFLTTEARIILMASDEERKRECIRNCALNPELYRKLWDEYSNTGLPSDETLRDILLFDYKFNDKSVNSFIRDFRATIEFAQLKTNDQIKEEKEKENKTSNLLNNIDYIFNPKPKDKMEYKDFTIPQKGKESAILRLVKPISREDIENIKKWLEFFGDTIIDSDAKIEEK